MYCRWPSLISRRAIGIDCIEREVRTHVVMVVVVGESSECMSIGAEVNDAFEVQLRRVKVGTCLCYKHMCMMQCYFDMLYYSSRSSRTPRAPRLQLFGSRRLSLPFYTLRLDRRTLFKPFTYAATTLEDSSLRFS